MTPPASRTRYHAFDALRASMMLLGLVLHVATAYTVSIPRQTWPFKDINTSRWADVLVFGIHSFRMPVFFVMAGFFAALLRERYGIPGMLRNRAVRILIPLVLAWILITPLTYLGWAFAAGQATGGHGWESVRQWLATRSLWLPYLLYLWFLYLLLWFYLAVALLSRLTAGIPSAWRQRGSAMVRRLVESPLWVLYLALPTAIVLFFSGGLAPRLDLFPAPLALLYNFIFLGFGWALYVHRDLLGGLKRGAWLCTILAFILYLFSLWPLRYVASGRPGVIMAVSVFNALIACLSISGLSGLALRYLDRPIRVVRYLTDAAYWFYLVHLPLALWLSGLLAPYDLPAALKILLVLLMLVPLLLLTYHFLVRPTAIGVLLGGKRRGTALEPAVVEGAQ